MIEHFNETSFTWDIWSGGNLTDMLNISTRKEIIISNSDVIRKHAIGWCKGDDVPCRSKPNTVAVMFLTNDIEWWTHFNVDEFLGCFPELKNFFIK